jgi:hypothetical protein
MSNEYATEKSFTTAGETGNASAGPSYVVGQEIMLSDRTLLRPIHGGLAEAGVVRERFLDSDGAYQYMVHFPGQAGTVLATRSDLQPLRPPFPAIDTSHGPVSWLADAETELVKVSARLHNHVSRGPMLDKDDSADQAALAAGLAKVCGLTPAELLDQLEPQITAKIRRNQRGSKTPSALTTSDSAYRKGEVPAVSQPGRKASGRRATVDDMQR